MEPDAGPSSGALSRRRSLAVVAGCEDVPTVWADGLGILQRTHSAAHGCVSSQTDSQPRSPAKIAQDRQGLRRQRPATAGCLQAAEQRGSPFAPFAQPEHCPKLRVAKCASTPGSQCLAVAVERPQRLPISCFCAALCDHQTTTSRPGRRWCSNVSNPSSNRAAASDRAHDRSSRAALCSSFHHPSPHTPIRRSPRSPAVSRCCPKSRPSLTPAVQCAPTANVPNVFSPLCLQ